MILIHIVPRARGTSNNLQMHKIKKAQNRPTLVNNLTPPDSEAYPLPPTPTC